MNIKIPLAYRSHRKIVDADGNFVVEVFSGGQGIEAADALQELVVTACNSHQQLVDALKNLNSLYVHAWDTTDGGLHFSPESVRKFERAHQKARAALAAAGEQV